ncbi:Thymidylate synthase-like protein, partial [Candidatus Magnetomorum sp. HK-1]
MIFITEKNPAEAWRKAFISLYNQGKEIEINGFYKNSCAAIEVINPQSSAYSEYYPIAKDQIEVINKYIITGENEDKIDHQWTKLYRKRLFCENNQIEKIISTLNEWPDCPRAQISTWKNGDDLKRDEIAPCLQLLW